MEKQEALRIIRLLSEGFDPLIGEQLPREHLVNQGDCVRALAAAVTALETFEPKSIKKKPKKHGKPWTKEDDVAIEQCSKRACQSENLPLIFQDPGQASRQDWFYSG